MRIDLHWRTAKQVADACTNEAARLYDLEKKDDPTETNPIRAQLLKLVAERIYAELEFLKLEDFLGRERFKI